MSEYILNSTSAQLGYTVPFAMVHDGKYKTKDKLKIQKTQPGKSKQHKTQQNKTTLVQSPLTTLHQETSWAYSIIIEKKLQFITLLTSIMLCFTHRKQQK